MLYVARRRPACYYGRLERARTRTFSEQRMQAGILDDKTAMAHIDRQNMLQSLEETPETYEQAYTAALKTDTLPRVLAHAPAQVGLIGIGGSAIAADVIKDWLFESKTKIEVVRGSKLPGSITKNTCALISSYSGETAETLEALKEARRRDSRVACIASEGKMIKTCQASGIPYVQVKAGFQPRVALPYLFSASLAMLVRWRICNHRTARTELKNTTKALTSLRDVIGFYQPYAKNPAKQLAIQLMGTFPFVYSSQFLSVAGRRFKNQLNENSKVIAKHESTPEMLHNEVQSWYMLKEAAFADSVSFVLLRGCETKDEAARLDQLATIIRDEGGRSVHEVSLGITSRLPAILATIYYCDFVSYYLAVARGVDPTPIETIWTLKRSPASQAA